MVIYIQQGGGGVEGHGRRMSACVEEQNKWCGGGGGGVKGKDDKSWCCGLVWGVGFAWVAEKGVASLW